MSKLSENVNMELELVLIGGGFVVLGALISSIYSSHKNWKQEKYFKLQKVSEEIIIALWNYTKLMDEIYVQGLILENNLESKRKQQDKYHDIAYSKIQVYFSEHGLTEVRDKSVILSHLIASEYIERLHEGRGTQISEQLRKIHKEISSVSNEIRDLLIVKVKKYSRSWYQNIYYYRVEKYN